MVNIMFITGSVFAAGGIWIITRLPYLYIPLGGIISIYGYYLIWSRDMTIINKDQGTHI